MSSLKGKAEESFFDSQPRLDSDCEDFFSVNGGAWSIFLNRHLLELLLIIPPLLPATVRTTRKASGKVSLDRAENAVPAQSPTDTKKQLIKVFRESFDEDDPSSKQQLENKPSTTSPYELIPNSVCSTGTTPYIGCLLRNEKPVSLCSAAFRVWGAI
ncbi:hypothetical protein V6N13_069699 [Hibiscus sabdariffa]